VNVADWLRNMGMGRYTAAFQAYGITAEVLRYLTADDLKDVGIVSEEHRRQLLAAIAEMRASMSFDEPDQECLDDHEDNEALGTIGERRQLSVLFCDLVGSTELSSRLDPEDLGAIIRVYQSRVTTAVEQFGGYVAHYAGDGILVYFGWPIAHEANAEQAVRGALAALEAVAAERVGTASLQVRIGTATGLVVVGEPVGTGEARRQTAIGRTPNLAARLQCTAQPGCLMIDATTRWQIGNLFECQDLGLLALKGFPEQVPAWRVVTSAHRSRSEALHSAGSRTPMLGRDEELHALSQCWLEAKSGKGCVVLLAGEAGIGKSRLVATFMKQLGDEAYLCSYFCSPQHRDSPLFPIRNAPSFGRPWYRDPDEAGNRDPNGPSRDEDPILIALPDEAPASSGRQGPDLDQWLEAFPRRVAEAAARRPVFMLFEDAHWIDPTSLALLDRLVASLPSLPVLLVVSSRPGFKPAWIDRPHVTHLTLSGLSRREALMLARRTAEPDVVPTTTLEQIVRRAEGLPLYVEELTRAVVQADWHDAGPATPAPVGELPNHTVPAALYAPLAARIDQLHGVRDVVQAAAVIGYDFTLELLAGVTRLSEPALLDALAELSEARLICCATSAGSESYVFSHMLIRDVAYGMLLRERRRQLHQQVAALLQGRCLGRGDVAAPEVLAHHYALAGLHEPAVRYWLLAGRRAFRMAAYREAARHLRKGVMMLDRVPEGSRRAQLASELKSTQSLVRSAAKGYGHAFQSVFASWRGGHNSILPLWDESGLEDYP
jgi:class 3 adenylate cyclase